MKVLSHRVVPLALLVMLIACSIAINTTSAKADGPAIVTSTTTTTVVYPTDLDPGPVATALTNGSGRWFLYNDTNDTIDNSLGAFVTGIWTPPSGVGSIRFTLAGTNPRYNIATYRFAGTPLASITTLGFTAYSAGGGGAGASESPFLHFNTDFTGVGTNFQRRLVFVPGANGPVPQGAWNSYDAIAGGSAKWSYSGPSWPTPGTGAPCTSACVPGTTTKTWNQVLADYPAARILPTDAFFGVRVGEPGPVGYTAFVDSVTFGTAVGIVKYDFEPTPTVQQILDQINASAATDRNKNALSTYLRSAKSYLALGTPTMKAAACQQLKLFNSAVPVAMRNDPAVAALGLSWIAQSNAIRASIPCVAPN